MCLVDIFYCFLWPEKQSSVGNQAGVVVVKRVKARLSCGGWPLCWVFGVCVHVYVMYVCGMYMHCVCYPQKLKGTIPYLGTEAIDHCVMLVLGI